MKALLESGTDHSAQDMFGRTQLYHVTLGRRRDDVARASKPLIDVEAASATLGSTKNSGVNLHEDSEDRLSRSISSFANADQKQVLSAVRPHRYWWFPTSANGEGSLQLRHTSEDSRPCRPMPRLRCSKS